MKKTKDIFADISDKKNDPEQIKRYIEELRDIEDRYTEFKLFPPLRHHRDINEHAIHVYHHVIYQVYVRAKHIHHAIVGAVKQKDGYSSFILLKAYWETVGMLGYSHIVGKNLVAKGDFKELLNWAVKHGLGGKHFPGPEMLNSKGLKAEEFQQTNLLTMMKKVDDDFNRTIGKGQKASHLEEVYKEFIGESGHPTFIGLSICEEKIDTIYGLEIIPNTQKSWNEDDLGAILSHLSISNLMMFHYWDRFIKEKDKQLAIFS